MHQFLCGGAAVFAQLKRRAWGRCLQFHDQAMPPGSSPSRARVGFEVNPSNNAAVLFVEHGIRYQGSNSSIWQWLAEGEKRFPSCEELWLWMQHELAPAYAAEHVSQLRPDHLTDLAAVRQQLEATRPPVLVDPEQLLAELSGSVRGQEPALRLLARRVCQHLARCAPRRPATFFAVGPTGVGKTRAAESLPAALKNLDPSGMGCGYVRLDMAEYQERHRISQLLGAPQGYVGYGDRSQLVDALVANPKTVVLFDEIEKAHPDVLRSLMNAMDAGRISSPSMVGRGHEVNCRQAIFLFTSNLECDGISSELEERAGFEEYPVVDSICRQRLRVAGMAPELIGRIGTFLVFQPLNLDTRAEIAALSVKRVAEEYGLRVERVAPAVILAILKRVRPNGFGIRPDEYEVGDLLGYSFAQAAAQRPTGPIEVCGGPPFHCVALA